MEFTTVSLWEIGVLFAGVGFFIFCVWIAFRLVQRLGGTVNRLNRTLDKVDREIGPLLHNVNTTVTSVNTNLAQVEGELEKVGVITDNASHLTSNVANITSLVTAAVGSPLVKVAALGFGLRSAVKRRGQEVDEEQVRRMVEASKQNKRERKAAKKARTRGN
ncbi:DUF948 domain-containing protein [Glycomyces tarimensis]